MLSTSIARAARTEQCRFTRCGSHVQQVQMRDVRVPGRQELQFGEQAEVGIGRFAVGADGDGAT